MIKKKEKMEKNGRIKITYKCFNCKDEEGCPCSEPCDISIIASENIVLPQFNCNCLYGFFTPEWKLSSVKNIP